MCIFNCKHFVIKTTEPNNAFWDQGKTMLVYKICPFFIRSQCLFSPLPAYGRSLKPFGDRFPSSRARSGRLCLLHPPYVSSPSTHQWQWWRKKESLLVCLLIGILVASGPATQGSKTSSTDVRNADAVRYLWVAFGPGLWVARCAEDRSLSRNRNL